MANILLIDRDHLMWGMPIEKYNKIHGTSEKTSFQKHIDILTQLGHDVLPYASFIKFSQAYAEEAQRGQPNAFSDIDLIILDMDLDVHHEKLMERAARRESPTAKQYVNGPLAEDNIENLRSAPEFMGTFAKTPIVAYEDGLRAYSNDLSDYTARLKQKGVTEYFPLGVWQSFEKDVINLVRTYVPDVSGRVGQIKSPRVPEPA